MKMWNNNDCKTIPLIVVPLLILLWGIKTEDTLLKSKGYIEWYAGTNLLNFQEFSELINTARQICKNL